jgi:hypothetical protein
MPTWYNYSAVTPVIERYIDDGSRDLCLGRLNIDNVGNFEVAVVGEPTSIELIRVATLDSDGNLTEEQQRIIGRLIDHMLSILRFTYDEQIDLVRYHGNPISFGCFDANGKPNLSLKVQEVSNRNRQINGDNIRNVFLQTASIRPLMKLLSDTQNPALPLQYQFLSLYKAFELEFRVGKKWPGLADLISPYEERYKALNIGGKTMANALHDLRDRCAHIKTGTNDELGVIGLDSADASKVASILPLLREIMFQHVATKFSHLDLKFTPPGA